MLPCFCFIRIILTSWHLLAYRMYYTYIVLYILYLEVLYERQKNASIQGNSTDFY